MKNKQAQSALEYLLLLAIVGAVVMIGFRQDGWLGKTQTTTTQYFNSVSRAIIGGEGNEPTPIDGGWCGFDGKPLADSAVNQCPDNLPCGTTVVYRRCACPEPAFGGKHCMENEAIKSLAKVDCSAKAPICADCTGKDDSCDAVAPSVCNQAAIGLTRCSKKQCTISFPCQCEGDEPTDVAGECVGTTSNVPPNTSWSVVGHQSDCFNNPKKCLKYRSL